MQKLFYFIKMKKKKKNINKFVPNINSNKK